MAKGSKVDGPESKMFESILETQSTRVSITIFKFPRKANRLSWEEKEYGKKTAYK